MWAISPQTLCAIAASSRRRRRRYLCWTWVDLSTRIRCMTICYELWLIGIWFSCQCKASWVRGLHRDVRRRCKRSTKRLAVARPYSNGQSCRVSWCASNWTRYRRQRHHTSTTWASVMSIHWRKTHWRRSKGESIVHHKIACHINMLCSAATNPSEWWSSPNTLSIVALPPVPALTQFTPTIKRSM